MTTRKKNGPLKTSGKMQCPPGVLDALGGSRPKHSRWYFKSTSPNLAFFRDGYKRPAPRRARCPEDWEIARAVEDKMIEEGYLYIDDMYDGKQQGVHHFVAPNRSQMETVIWKGADLHSSKDYQKLVV